MTNEAEKSPEEVVRDFNKKQERKKLIITGIVAFLLIFAVLSSNSEDSSNTTSSPYPVIEEDLTGWIPTEFNSYSDDPNVGWRWLKKNEYNCSYSTSDGCWGMMIITKDGCKNSLYAEISILDKNDVQIGYTNETASQALPMQKTKFVFDSFDAGSDSARLSKISCY